MAPQDTSDTAFSAKGFPGVSAMNGKQTGLIASQGNPVSYWRAAGIATALAAPLAVWLAPISASQNAKIALAISAFMVVAWMFELMEYAATGLLGLLLFWYSGIASPSIIFSGFVNDASWFYLGAMLIGAMATKTGLPQRIGSFVVAQVGVTYSRLVLGLIIIDFLLTFIVPSGAATLVVVASIALGVLNVFGAEKGSNVGRGLFLVITYTTSIFNKMILAGTAAIIARSLIESVGGVSVSWALWFAAFFPCAIATILASWWIVLKLFPQDADVTGSAEMLRAHFKNKAPWNAQASRAATLCALALGLWLTDWWHHIPPSMVAFAVGLMGFLPGIGVLDEQDFKRINLLPFFFVAAALGMGEVLKSTGALNLITDTVMAGMTPLLTDKLVATTALYWGGFVYHFVTASEISMLATSLPILMEFSKAHNLDPAWVGMIWSFASGGKLFAYQSAVLVLGYSYGYFRHVDLIKVGALLTVLEFVVLALSVGFYWPLLGLG